MINIIVWILFGALAGWIASLLTQNEAGVSGDILTGILGALVGGLLVNAFGGMGVTVFSLSSLFVALTVAVALLLGFRSVNRE
jgi:uncharacterized membrane protein YeaQ/YmgE (transglycosylase-associated protein family)